MSVVLRDAEVDGARTDVLVKNGTVVQVSSRLDGDEVVDAAGGALLPGLHDHHVHLLALARARTSVDVRTGLDALAAVPGTGWVRAVGLQHDADAAALDAVVPDRPVRVQHRSGALWVLNSAALRSLELPSHPGVERDRDGRPTGRLWRMDEWLRDALGPDPLDLLDLAQEFQSYGITGVTDATPAPSPLLTEVRLHVTTMAQAPVDGCRTGPYKVVLADHDLPGADHVAAQVTAARRQGRAVAVHCVTREALLLLLAVLDEVGAVPGDRVEHGAVIDHATARRLTDLGIAVVTQPGFLADRGDDYLRDVAAHDLPDLYPYARLTAAGVTCVASSDAPYGPVDPWEVIAAARDRTARSGAVLTVEERVNTAEALSGYLRGPDLAPREVVVGAPADLVLLHVPLAEALRSPHRDLVRRTWSTR
jgi:predicted amidohydrolase YtcJ